MLVDEQDARRLLAAARVARLATVTPRGRPHVVPVTFAVEADTLWTAVDAKPKRHPRLQRLANIAANPDVSVLVDHFDEDWSRLWWVRVDGTARVHDAAPAALAVLADKYEQYRHEPPPGPVVEVGILRWRWWSAR